MHLIPNLTIERRGCDSCATIHTLAVSLTPYYAYPNIACEQRYVVFTLISDVYSIKLGNPTSNPYAIPAETDGGNSLIDVATYI